MFNCTTKSVREPRCRALYYNKAFYLNLKVYLCPNMAGQVTLDEIAGNSWIETGTRSWLPWLHTRNQYSAPTKCEALKGGQCYLFPFLFIVAKEAAFPVRIFHVFIWTCSKLEHGATRKAGWSGLVDLQKRGLLRKFNSILKWILISLLHSIFSYSPFPLLIFPLSAQHLVTPLGTSKLHLFAAFFCWGHCRRLVFPRCQQCMIYLCSSS